MKEHVRSMTDTIALYRVNLSQVKRSYRRRENPRIHGLLWRGRWSSSQKAGATTSFGVQRRPEQPDAGLVGLLTGRCLALLIPWHVKGRHWWSCWLHMHCREMLLNWMSRVEMLLVALKGVRCRHLRFWTQSNLVLRRECATRPQLMSSLQTASDC